MRTRSILVLVACVASFAAPSRAMRPAASPDAFKALPTGDAVVTIDMANVIGKAIPALVGTRPTSKAKFDANISSVQTDFGLDVRQLRTVAISASLFGARLEWVAVLDGKLDSISAAGSLGRSLDAYVNRNPRYAVRSESSANATLYVISEKLAGGTTVDRSALTVLDSSTGLFGTPGAVRRALDVRSGKAPNLASDPALVEAYAQSDATSPVRAGLVLDAVAKAQSASDPDDTFTQTLATVRYVFGSLGVDGAGGLSMRIVARAKKPESVKSIFGTLGGLIDLARGQFADNADIAALLKTVTVSQSGSDVVVAADVPQERLDTLFQLIDKNRSLVGAP